MENLDPITDNQDPEVTQEQEAQSTSTPTPTQEAFSWKSRLSPDIQKAPSLTKFEDTPEGLCKAFESHLSLEKLLGHEKVPLPKGPDDKEGRARFNKALGIPDKPEGYKLEDVKLPESMKGMAFDKKEFAQLIHSIHATPEQASGLWKAYTDLNIKLYQKAVEDHQNKMNEIVNALRSEWGDAYDANVDLGQTVINKFASDQEENDFLTASLTKDPRFVKFLAKIGNQFAENKIGEFSVKRFAKSPNEAQLEIDKIMADPNHPYLNPKADAESHKRAVEYVNSLYAVIARASGQA